MEGLSVVLPVRWDSELLTHWLEMYEKYSELDNQLIIVADQPTWEVLRVLQKKCLKYYLVETSNFYENLNYGAKLATKEYIAFMHEDFQFSPKWDYNIRRRMTENAWGGAFKLAPIDSDPMRNAGSHFCKEEGNILSFDFNIWEKYCSSRSVDKIVNGHPLIYTLHKKTFDKIYGFGTCFSEPNGHIQHESATWVRLSNIGGIRWEALDTFCLHFKFKAAIDLKNHEILDAPYIPKWGRQFQPWPDVRVGTHCNNWSGVIHCRDCNKTCDPVYSFGGWPACQQNIDRQNIMLQGYWLCETCKQKGLK